jgi:hypothetical protein
MNEMIEIKKKPGESVWEVDRKFKSIKGKLKYIIIDTQHRHLFVNYVFPHLKYPLREKKFQSQGEAMQETIQLEENQYKHTNPAVEELKQDLENLTFQLNQNKGKEKREDVCCTMCRTKGHDKNDCLLFSKSIGLGMPNHLASGGTWCEI